MADSSGRGPTKPLYRVDGQLTDRKPPKTEGRAIAAVEGPGRDGRRVVTMGPARSRPAFPRRPLDLTCLEPSDLPADQKAEVVRWVRKAQPDFDPERDPNGWISVAVKVRDAGYGEEEVRRMGYLQLEHVFRSLWPKMNGETTGNIFAAAETSTGSIVYIDGAPEPEPEPRNTSQNVFRVGGRGRDTRKIDVDGALGKLEAKMRKELAKELGSETAAQAALVDRLYSLSAENLRPLLKAVGCDASAKTISRSDKYISWERYRRPAAPPDVAIEVGPAACQTRPSDAADAADKTFQSWRRDAGLSDVRPSAADAAADAIDSGHLSKRTGGRGITRIGKTAAERAAEDAADRFARENGVDLPPPE